MKNAFIFLFFLVCVPYGFSQYIDHYPSNDKNISIINEGKQIYFKKSGIIIDVEPSTSTYIYVSETKNLMVLRILKNFEDSIYHIRVFNLINGELDYKFEIPNDFSTRGSVKLLGNNFILSYFGDNLVRYYSFKAYDTLGKLRFCFADTTVSLISQYNICENNKFILIHNITWSPTTSNKNHKIRVFDYNFSKINEFIFTRNDFFDIKSFTYLNNVLKFTAYTCDEFKNKVKLELKNKYE